MSRMMGFIHDEIERQGSTVDYCVAEDVPPRYRGRLARFIFPWLVWRRVVAAARAGRPYDIVNVHEPSGGLVATARVSGRPRVVVTSHGVEQRGWEIALEEGRLGREGPSLKSRVVYPLTALWQARRALRQADHVLCLSYQDQAYLMDRFGRTADTITPMAPAADPIYAEAAGERRYDSVRRLLFFGTWIKRKGTIDLVDAFIRLAERYPELGMSVIGAGVPPEVVRNDFPRDLRDRVDCFSNLSEGEIARLLLDADIFVLPSLFEGTPQTLIEAMATGMPAVTCATSGMKDVITDGVNGLLIPVRSPDAIVDAVDRLIQDRPLRERIGRAAHERAAEYTWPGLGRKVAEVYERLAGGNG